MYPMGLQHLAGLVQSQPIGKHSWEVVGFLSGTTHVDYSRFGLKAPPHNPLHNLQ